MADMNKIALALQGFGAGVQGQGPEFLRGLEERRMAEEQLEAQQRQQLDEQRKQALLQDSFAVRDQLRRGDVGGARALLQDRLQSIQQLGGDPSDTAGVLSKIESGDIPGALADVSTVVNFAEAQGLLKAPAGAVAPKQQIVGQQVVTIDPATGEAVARDIAGFQEDPNIALDREIKQQSLEEKRLARQSRERDRDLRERQLAVSEAAEERQSTKLSAGLEKALLTAQDRVVEAQRNANEYTVLADDFSRLKLEGGLKSTFSESLKGILGTQDDVSEFRRRFNKVRLSEGLKNLPPGPATDRDVQEAFKGVPKDNASSEQVASFLRGAARLARFEAGFNQFKADFISNKSTGKGLNQGWRRSIASPALKRKVSVAEIYETAQNRGITPEAVLDRLGITEGLF